MNLSEIQGMLYARLGFSAATISAIDAARFLSYINESHREVLSTKGMGNLRRSILTFDSVANSPFAVMPQAITRIYNVQDRTNRRILRPIALGDLREIDPGLSYSVSVPSAYVLMGLQESVALQPSAAAELFVKSTAAGDGATKTAFIEGVITGGYPRTASVVLNGVTAVSFGATITTWIAVRKFYIALTAGGVTTAAGNITLNQTSGAGTELSRIPIGKAVPRYVQIQLFPFPTASLTYYADVEMRIETMTQASDEPLIPEDFHDLMVIRPLMKEYSRREKPIQYGEEKANWVERMGQLRSFAGKLSGLDDMRPQEYSQLGPMFRGGS